METPTPFYDHAPIVEAVLAIQVEVTNPDLSDKLSDVVEEVSQLGFKRKGHLRKAHGHFRLGGDDAKLSATATDILFATTFESNDKLDIGAFRLDGLNLSRLQPYLGWEPFLDAFQSLWTAYKGWAGEVRVVRLGARYINRITIPSREVNLGKYFRFHPAVQSEHLSPCSSFLMQISLPLPEPGAEATVSMAPEPAAAEAESHSFVLDIDVYRKVEVPQTDSEIWAAFGELRTAKNRIFENCITADSRTLFK